MKKQIRKTLSENIQTIVTYQRKKLSTKINVKEKTEFYHQSNLVYYGKCPNQHCIKSVRIWNYSGPHFPAFGLNTPYLSIFSTNTDTFHAVQTCTEDYIGENDRRIKERIADHNKHDKNYLILKHSR